MMSQSNKIWITWERQTRNISMAKLLECSYIELKSNKPRIIRYAILGIKTLKILLSKDNNIIFYQNPSIILAAICAAVKIIRPEKIIVGDFHNAALTKNCLEFLNAFAAKNSDFILVSNKNLFPSVTLLGGKPIEFPDPIPNPSKIEKKSGKKITLITSWSDDEPINDTLDAFISSKLWEKDFTLQVTGKTKPAKLKQTTELYAKYGITFLGFVSEETYWECISASILNIDLTTREDCMVCGAYESIAAETPVLLSNNEATLQYFGAHAIFTDNSIEDIKAKLIYACDNIDPLLKIASAAKNTFMMADLNRKMTLEKLVKPANIAE